MRKWFKLENQFKKIEDNNKQTGRANKSWKFYNQLEQCIGDSPRVHSEYTFDTAIPSTSSSTDSEKGSVVNSDCDDDTDGNDVDECDGDDSMAKKPKKLKNRQRKRKSKSSAAEMLAFLESYTAKREKVDEEKLKLMRENQEKKDTFFTQFLEILKNK